MLEFIVLGIIPGTQIQLSPMGVFLLWTTIIVAADIALKLHLALKLIEDYGQTGTYYVLVTKKHRLTRRLRSAG